MLQVRTMLGNAKQVIIIIIYIFIYLTLFGVGDQRMTKCPTLQKQGMGKDGCE